MKFTKFDKLREKLHLKTKSLSRSKRASLSAANFKRKQKLFTRASPMKLTKLYRHMKKEQKDMITNADFSGLLEIKCSKLQPELCKFLMESFNPTSCAMVFPGRGVIPITDDDVHSVLRIPMGSKEVRFGLDPQAISFMTEQFGIEGSKQQPSITALEEILIQMKTADNRYLRLWIVYVMCSVLAPTTGTTVSPRLYPSLLNLNVKKAKQLNFCKFVIQILCSTAKAKGKNIFKACMLFIMIKYLDSLEIPDLDVCPDGSWVSAWTNEMVKTAMDADRTTNGSFGMLQLKEQYRKSEHVLFTSALNIDMFVRVNTPEDCTSKELLRYKEAVEGACIEFEGVLQRFIRKASGKDDSVVGTKWHSPASREPRRTKRQRAGILSTDQDNISGCSPPEEDTQSNSDGEYKCGTDDTADSSEDVSLEDEDADVLGDNQVSGSEDSDFVQIPKQVRPLRANKPTSTQVSGSEDSDFVQIPKQVRPLRAIKPASTRMQNLEGKQLKGAAEDSSCLKAPSKEQIDEQGDIMGDMVTKKTADCLHGDQIEHADPQM